MENDIKASSEKASPDETKDFDQKLVEKIKQEKITPKPRWHFLLKDYVIWLTGTIALLIGAAAVSVMIFFFKYNGWEISEQTHKSIWEFILLTLPYFWIIFLGLFIFILYYNLKHTKQGYRYPVWLIVVISVAASVLLGALFFALGWGAKIDDLLGTQMPMYDTVFNRQLVFWYQPDDGRLTGIVWRTNSDNTFNIIDPRGNSWQIFISDHGVLLGAIRIGQPVDIIGKMSDDNIFQADFIRSIRSGRGFLARPHSHNGSFNFLPPPAPLGNQ